jgi:hypothetical protein
MMDRLSKTLAALALLALAACSRASGPSPLAGDPYVRGPVESFTHHATASRLLVRGAPDSRESCGIAATVDARTRYLRRARSGELRPASRANVGVGDTVEVYVAGPIAESCPPQAYAAAVVLTARP